MTVATPTKMATIVRIARTGRAAASPRPRTTGCGSLARDASLRSQRPLWPRGAVALAITTAGLSRPARSAGSSAAIVTMMSAPAKARRSRAGEKVAW